MTLLAKRQERSIVPRMYYITTAIDYTNGPPHIGHAYEKVLADVLARWHRMKGEEVYFLTGVDQHGQKVQQTAEKLGITPQEHVNNITGQFLALWTAWESAMTDGPPRRIRATRPACRKS